MAVSPHSPGLQESPLTTFEHQAGQNSRGKCARIDADPVRPHHHIFADRVPVHHHAAVILVAFQEFMPDPEQVRVTLVLQRDPGPDARVNKQVIALGMKGAHFTQEPDMTFRNPLNEIIPYAFRIRFARPGWRRFTMLTTVSCPARFSNQSYSPIVTSTGTSTRPQAATQSACWA